MKKELNRFVCSPVFVINAGFGLVLYVVGCILVTIKLEGTVQTLTEQGMPITIEEIKANMPLIQFGLVCFASLMTSITCSMISLEGKTFNILKSLPIKPSKIIMSKVYTAVLIMIPFILIGDLIMFIKYTFNIWEILIILALTIIMPLVSEIIGIIANLLYPKMNAENDTEVVKQSMSSFVSVIAGMVLTGLTIYLLVKAVQQNIQTEIIMLLGLGIYTLAYFILMLYLKKVGTKKFNEINV